jgi:hypothetical protein
MSGHSRIRTNFLAGILTTALFFLLMGTLPAQFTPDEIADRPLWENFLRTANIVRSEQLSIEEGVTEPWKLTLTKDGTTRFALWKDARGTQMGFYENWKYEIAAYELDKILGLNMVPPTVEKRFRRKVGSCQLWIEDADILRRAVNQGLDRKIFQTTAFKRAAYIQQLFDNLIGNEDRNTGNLLITSDRRSILIDHSRTFRTTPAFTEGLPFSREKMGGAEGMRELPRVLVEKVRILDEKTIVDAVGKYLSKKEIRAILSRLKLILSEIDRLVAVYGEERVLY